jgi:vitamin B12 transporter
LRADYTYTDALDAATRLALLRRPRHKASLSAGWQATDDLTLDATLLYVGPQIDGNRDFSIPRLKMPDYVTLDLAASYRLSDKWALFGRIENAFDTDYQSPDGFLRPRIGAYGGIKVNL